MEKFANEMERIGSALSDETRRRIFTFLQQAGSGVSAAEVAGHFGIHRTVARIHLEKLTASGLCAAQSRRHAGGGRPAKIYSIESRPIELQYPPRQFRLLSKLLLETTKALGPARIAKTADAGRDYGREMGRGASASLNLNGGTLPLAATHAVAFLNEAGAHARLLSCGPKECLIESTNCIFDEVARDDPKTVCRLDLAILDGYLSEAFPATTCRQICTVMAGAPTCRIALEYKDEAGGS